ncbi:N-acetylgalactosaminyltransferase 7-like [Diadema setosum]|uniref:N-acetylgalactosaminyltransferase 7-like n=1 Tax=Diadema setosum TaxID=31175 RepID=UPI003B3A809A
MRFRAKRCVLLLTLCVAIFFMLRTLLFIPEMSEDGDRHGLDTNQKHRKERFDHDVSGGERDNGHRAAMDAPSVVGAFFRPGTLGNYEPMSRSSRSGLGEGGVPVKTLPEEKGKVDQLIQEYGFNQYVSDKISLDRNIPDLRSPQCRHWHYPESLPTTSVIIVFHNEGWSTLMRTVHSVFNRTPPQLLHEIVLVDDFSTKEHLKWRLENYINDPVFGGKIELVRNPRREGLIRTRIIGARHATGDVLLWLDAHCEVGINWLPPLVTPIAVNRTTAVCPIIDVIDNMDYRVYPQGTGDQDRGGFDWSLYWKHFPLPDFEKRRRHHPTEPYRSPAMAGGLFAMDRKYFFELGAYDEGLEIWGGENFELSFKIWMCGGSLVWVPCSRVGHVYRILGKVPYSAPNGSMLVLSERNLRRVVEVWFDDYKEYFYRSKPESLLVSPGNLEKQLAFRREKKCKSFSWFMSEIAPDIVDKYPLPHANKHWGEIRTRRGPMCIDSLGSKDGGRIGMSYCHGAGGNQLFRVTDNGQLRIHDQCAFNKYKEIRIRRCDGSGGGWTYDESNGLIRQSSSGLCVDHRGNELIMSSCDVNLDSQLWEISTKNLKHH